MQARSSNNAQGIDISHHNGTVDWAKVRADGISFAFLKASEGRSYRDPTFPGHLKAARAAGILVGAYHFVTSQSVDAAREEAANFMGAITAAGGIDLLDLPPVMDYENNPGQLTKAQINAVAESFLTTVESLSGRRPIIYTGNSFAANFGANLGAYPLWVARYSTTPPTDVAAWGKWTFWQYSDGQQGGARSDGSRSVAGVSGYVDLNEYAGTEEQLRAAYIRPDALDNVKVVVNDKLAAYGRVIDGHVYLPLRKLGEALGKAVHWDNEAKLPYVDGHAVETFSIIDGTTYVGVRAAAEMLGSIVSWDGETKKVYFYG